MTTPAAQDAPDALAVPGARLFYEVVGSGPLLLLIPGGAADADIFAPIVPHLADRYTVVRYDPRGISRSHLDGPPEEVPVAQHADDAHRLLAAIGDEPAYVLGSSGGGTIGLALVERQPDAVRALIAHEPPVVQLLPEGAPGRTIGQEVYDAYRQEGVAAAMQRFIAITGLGEQQGEPTPEMREAMTQLRSRMQQNVMFFLDHYMRPITAYVPDIARLQASPSRVVVGIGADSGGQLAHETALALADRLGRPAVTFPGGHAGYLTHPEAFAGMLSGVLDVN